MTDGFVAAGLVLAAVLVIQQVEGNVLYPVVVGRSLHLHPTAMLLVLGAGSLVGGVAGALFAVPIGSVAVVTAKYLRRRKHRRDETEAAPSADRAEVLGRSEEHDPDGDHRVTEREPASARRALAAPEAAAAAAAAAPRGAP